MPTKDFATKLGFTPKNGALGVFIKKYTDGNAVEIDFEKGTIYFGGKIKIQGKETQNITKAEDWVVLECLNRLLEKGYKSENISLEKVYPAGHGFSGRLDICVTDEGGSEYLLIECKTYGKEFDKELNRINRDGGQLFTYFKFSNKAAVIMLYASELSGDEIIFKNEIVKIEEDYRSGDVKDFYEKWNKLTKDNGVFDSWVKPYNFESKALRIDDLHEIRQEDSSFIFNRFLEILRHNVVSDKGNAFNRIFTLFLCKIYDEKFNEGTDNELGFQWLEGIDDHRSFQLRLTDLYKSGMHEFLEKVVTDFSETEFNNKFQHLEEGLRNSILSEFQKIRLEKNNEFAIKDVYDEQSFNENAVVVKEIVQLLEKYKLRYTKKQQYLSDFFELLLTTGLKQESGQFFTPVPVAQFVIKSLPIDTILEEKLSSAKIDNDTLLPYVMDYAAGSGHFLTETMHEMQRLIKQKDDKNYNPSVAKKIRNWQDDHFAWAIQYVYGIEKDYRLVKVGKVGCYLHGDGLANVIHSDGLAHFSHPDYKGKLLSKDKNFPQDNKQFEILVSNPPYSVSAFKNSARSFYKDEDFELYGRLTDNSSEIECLFIERTKQLLKDGGVAGIILPSSILSNTGIYSKSRELILQYFEIIGIAELGSNTFMATGTNTVTLFLRRRNNYESINLKKDVEKLFTDYIDVTINGIEKPVAKFVNHVWRGINFDDYLSMLKKEPNKTVQKHEIYEEYKKKIKAKDHKEFWTTLLRKEADKLFYFILALPQRVVLVKSGEKDAEKRFLGYEFSNRRGNEGIRALQRGKNIEECTQLFDPEVFDNPIKASTYIYKAFHGDFDFPIDKSMQNNISRHNLVDMLTFDRVEFEKNISLSIKKKVKIESKWEFVKLGDEADLITKGTTPTSLGFAFETKGINFVKVESILEDGQIDTSKFEFINQEANEKLNRSKLKEHDILFSIAGALGRTTIVSNEILPANTNQALSIIRLKSDSSLLVKYTDLVLRSWYIQSQIEYLKVGVAQSNLSLTQISEFQIPKPPINTQKEIVFNIESLEASERKAKLEIDKNRDAILSLLNTALSKANKILRLADENIFEVSIGKRVLKNEFVSNGNIPVYSANVREPFGKIDRLLINNFDVPSVLWGIDGDWMVNLIPKNYPFYPTDHCGVLRVKNSMINEKYLAFVLEKEGMLLEFSRTKRASIDRVQGIKIPVPSLLEQEEIVKKIEKIEVEINKLKMKISVIPMQKEEILKKYLL